MDGSCFVHRMPRGEGRGGRIRYRGVTTSYPHISTPHLASLRAEVGEGRVCKETPERRAYVPPLLVGRTGVRFQTLFTPQQTLRTFGDVVEVAHDVSEWEIARRDGESEAASRTARRCEHPFTGEHVQDLGQIVLRHAEALRDITDAHRVVVPGVRQTERGAQGVDGRFREDQESKV